MAASMAGTIRSDRAIGLRRGRAQSHDGRPVESHCGGLRTFGNGRACPDRQWPPLWRALSDLIGPLAYVVAGLKAMMGAQSKATAAGCGHSATGELVLIGNGRLYGGHYPI